MEEDFDRRSAKQLHVSVDETSSAPSYKMDAETTAMFLSIEKNMKRKAWW